MKLAAVGKDQKTAAMDIAIADRGNSQVVIAIMQEADVRAVVSSPLVTYVLIRPAQAEDGPLSTTKAHPRASAPFPRVLAEYVRTQHTMPLEEAVRKMTSQAASRAGITDRGVLRPGMTADIAIFNPATIKDVATYTDPLHYFHGNGGCFRKCRPVLLDGKITDERPGKSFARSADLGCCDRKGLPYQWVLRFAQSRRVMCQPWTRRRGIMARHGRIPPESEFLMFSTRLS